MDLLYLDIYRERKKIGERNKLLIGEKENFYLFFIFQVELDKHNCNELDT